MTVIELKNKRAALWNDMKRFLEGHRQPNGTLSAEDDATYTRMEGDMDALDREITRQERIDARDAALAAPEAAPIRVQPGSAAQNRDGVYAENFWKALRAKVPAAEVTNALETGTDAEGGYLVPDEFHNAVVQGLADNNVLRSLATVIRTTHDRKIPVMSSAGTAYLVAEEAAYTEADPTFGQVTLGAYKIGRLCKASEELVADSAFDLQRLLTNDFTRAIGAKEQALFISGTGSGQPTGLLTSAATGVTAAATTSITSDEVIDLFYSVKAGYRRRGTWLMNAAVIKAIRKLKASGSGEYLWQPGLADRPDTILGRPVRECDDMPSAIAASAKTIAFGDFSYFWIADRRRLAVRRLNELYAANGQVGFIGAERTDGVLTLSEAVKVLVQKAS